MKKTTIVLFAAAFVLLSMTAACARKDAGVPAGEIHTGDIIYFGSEDPDIRFDRAWRVLDAEKTNTGEPGMFLVCENLIGSDEEQGMCFRNESAPVSNAYRGSDAQKWCAGFYESHFSEAEKAAMLETTKSDAAYAKEHVFDFSFSGEAGQNTAATVNFDAVENILDGDKIFLLSAEEADRAEYGFVDADSRIVGFGEEPANWWLRSPHDPSFPIDVGIVFFNGWLLDYYENQDHVFGTGPICMRPAFNLDTEKILSVKSVGEGEWELSLVGESAA